MRLMEKARVTGHLLRWRLTWDRRDLEYCPQNLDAAVFRSASDAIALLADGDVVLSCGLAANARCSIFFWALRERFERTARPRGLTWISVGAQGGRARVPGTVEELAVPGLIARYISGHVETAKALLRLADAGDLELHLLPQGEMARIIEAQGRGVDRLLSRTGVHSFLDPRCGRGSAVRGGDSFVRLAGDRLEYRLPRIRAALINAPYADAAGNVYFRNAATLTESLESARAARRNGGLVLVSVAGIIDPAPGEIAIPAAEIDAIVVNPRNEQTGGVPQRRYWPLFTEGSSGDTLAELQKLRFVNDVLGYTPARGAADQALARLGARVFAANVAPGSTVNLGVGYGEEVVRMLCATGLHREVVFTTETGVYGGVPAPGIYFGAAVHPQRLRSSAWMFRHYLEHLDAAILGFVEVDGAGNVNGSERGDSVLDLVGPGGMPSIVDAARTVLFVGAWMSGARWDITGQGLALRRPGRPKFVARVRAVTVAARAMREQGKRVLYVTHVGVFRLTAEGLRLEQLMPGVDLERDILARSEAPLHVSDRLETVPLPVVTGRGFVLQWPGPGPGKEDDDARR